MNHFPKIIGIAGVARAGKDTFFKYFLDAIKLDIQRIAFADELKKDLNNFLKSKSGISAFTNDTNEKNIIRPILVSYGCMMRDITEGRYWINKIDMLIEESRKSHFCLTDVRFPNEVDYIHNNSGIVIHLSRLDTDGNLLKPANEEEAAQNPLILDKANYALTWDTFEEDSDKYKVFVDMFLVDSGLDSLS